MFRMSISSLMPSSSNRSSHGGAGLALTGRVMRVVPRLRALGLLLPLLAGLATVQPVASFSQEPPVSSFQDEVSVGLVLVPVVVRSGAGYAKNLDQGDFRLTVEGKRVAIESFERRADAPASVVLLQDLSGSMETNGKLGWSREVVRESSDRWKAYGTTALHDVVASMPRISLEGRNPKRFALLVTDGVDNASRITPEQARAIVQEAQLPTYVLGLGSGNPYELTEGGKKIYRYADVLSLLAAVTGGRYYSIASSEDLQKALAAILDDVRHQYVLGFSTGDGAVRFRKLQVEIKDKAKDRRTIVFRRGYKGTPPAEPRAG